MRDQPIYCHNATPSTSDGMLWHGDHNPLAASVPLLLTQLSVIAIISRVADLCLKPLGQPSIVAQIIGGLVLGPSVLGSNLDFAHHLFPFRGSIIIETFATFGIMLFLFAIGVKTDTNMMIRPEKNALVIGLSLFVFSFTIPLIICLVLEKGTKLNPNLTTTLPIIAGSQCLTAFPVIACLLSELKIVNTEVGRLAISSAMFYNLMFLSLTAIAFAWLGTRNISFLACFGAVSSTIALVTIIIFIIRPLMLKFFRATSVGNVVTELHVFVVFLLVLLSGFMSEMVGQHYFLGPVVLGLSLPDASPLGTTIVSKLDTFVSCILYPTFLTVSGLKTNIFTITSEVFWAIGVVVFSGIIIKLGAVMVPAVYKNSNSIQEAFVLGLVMNARGINELIIYNLYKDDGTLTDEEFAVLVLTVLVITGLITPLIRVLYSPTGHYRPGRRLTIQHSKHDTELRVMVCIHSQDNVPTIINLMEASSTIQESALAVIVVNLVEIKGKSAPMLVAYRPNQTIDLADSESNHIYNAFQQYERQNEGTASVQIFTNMSQYSTMHDDVCRIACEKRANMLIVPFHKKWAIDGMTDSVNHNIQVMNSRLLETAPCSIGILVDKGPINGSLSVLNSSRSPYQVAVIFVGGADDMESLAYGSRMARHDNVRVTVFRYILPGSGGDNYRERKQECNVIEQYRHENIGNKQFLYQEEFIKDGVGLAESIKGLENGYDLIIVGRNHQTSSALYGLDDWIECPELGVVGDMLAAPDAGNTASVLVVQQQILSGNVINRSLHPAAGGKDGGIHDVPDIEEQRNTGDYVSLSVSKFK